MSVVITRPERKKKNVAKPLDIRRYVRTNIRTYIYAYIVWARKCVTQTVESGKYFENERT